MEWISEVLERPARVDEGVRRFVGEGTYADSFGQEWNWFPTTQLGAESRQTFFTKTGWSPAVLEAKTVLDAGCGMGRFARVAAECGARVAAVDLSRAVDAAARNLADFDVEVIQADVFDLPFALESFDLIYSIGVLHHTPDTRAAFERLVPLLKPGGTIAIWIYSGEPQHQMSQVGSDFYRLFTTRMDRERLLRWATRVQGLGRLYRTRFGRYLTPLLPVSTHEKREWRILDTFDWYSPRYQHKHRWREVESWFRDAGLTEIRRNGVPVAVSGVKPS